MARILMIAYTTYLHDARVQRHARALADRGDHVDLLCLENPLQGFHYGVNVIGLRLPRYRGSSRSSYFRSYLRFFTAATATAMRLALRQRYDIVMVCTMPDAAVLCALPLKLLGSKVVMDIHDTMPELYLEKFGGRRGALGARLLAITERTSAGMADRVLAVHDLHRDRLERLGVASSKISVVLNVPDQRLFQFVPNGHHVQKEFKIICHGTIAQRLGLDVAVHAMALVHRKLPAVKLCVAGNGDYVGAFHALVDEMGLASCIDFVGSVALDDLPNLLRQASLGLIPNRASSATQLMLPVKLLEYTTLGIPVVAARLKTIEHYFDEKALCYFEPGNPEDLARAIEYLYTHPAERQTLATNARLAMKSITWDHQLVNYLAAIDSLLRNNHQGTSDNSAAASLGQITGRRGQRTAGL